MHEIFLHHQAADENDSMNASGEPTTSRPAALHEPIAFSLMIAPQQACNLQLAALTVDIKARSQAKDNIAIANVIGIPCLCCC